MVQVPVSAVLVTIFSRYRDGDCCSCPDLPPGRQSRDHLGYLRLGGRWAGQVVVTPLHDGTMELSSGLQEAELVLSSQLCAALRCSAAAVCTQPRDNAEWEQPTTMDSETCGGTVQMSRQ